MNLDRIQGKWKQLKGSLRREFGDLTDDQWEKAAGSWEVFTGTLQESYGYTRDQIEKKVDAVYEKLFGGEDAHPAK